MAVRLCPLRQSCIVVATDILIPMVKWQDCKNSSYIRTFLPNGSLFLVKFIALLSTTRLWLLDDASVETSIHLLLMHMIAN